MIIAALAAALLPGLYWDQGTETAPVLKQAGIERICVPPQNVAPWRQAGFEVVAAGPDREKVERPGVQWKMNVASATRSPWIDANGWRFERKPEGKYLYEAGTSTGLAAAEAYAYAVDALVHPAPAGLDSLARMLRFLKQIDRPRMPAPANICIADDGSEELGEVLNLFSRRNLLYRVVGRSGSPCDLNIRVGSPEFPKEEAADPALFASKVRSMLTDDKRLVRIYGSEVVLVRLEGDRSHARLHLLNYGGRKVFGLRLRVRGTYSKGALHAPGVEDGRLTDYAAADGATEFTIPEMETYSVVDLEGSR